jgi:4-amino-4-deoxy-L-arabinose transferase-like glycosyltransferase
MIRTHREIIVVLALFVALGALYSTTTPLFEAPDERWHFAFVQHVATGRGLPVQTLEKPAHLARQEGSQPPLYYWLAAGLTFWIDTSDFPSIVWENPHYGYDVPGIINDNKNLFIHTYLESPPYHGAVLAIHLARLLSVLMGALAVLFTYLLMLEIFPDRRYLAASAAAVVGFVPQFLFVSSAVSNDSTIVAMAGLSLWMVVRLLVKTWRPAIGDLRSSPQAKTLVIRRHSPVVPSDVLALGVATGLAALAKVSGAGLVALGGLALLYVLRKDRKQLVLYAAGFAAVVCLVAGWWYLRNWLLYGELTGTAMMIRIFGARENPLTATQLLAQLDEVRETFWVGFGWGNIRAQPAVYWMLEAMVSASGLGLLLSFVRRRERLHPTLVKALPFFTLAAWIVIAFAELLHWMEITQAPHGRLFFPVLPALAPLAVFGLTQWAPRRLEPIVARVPAIGMFALAAIALFTILQPAYAFPLSLQAEPNIARRVDIVYGDKIKLLGYQVSSSRVAPGDWLEMTLYWESLAEMEQNYSIGIHLLDSGRRVISSRDSYPGHGMLPTSLWRAKQIIVDPYWIPIAADAKGSDIADIQVDLYVRETKQGLLARDPQGQTVTPIIGRLRIGGTNHALPDIRNKAQYVFGKQVALMGYDIANPMNQEHSGSGLLTLYWKRVASIPIDYTVFVHVLDVNGEIIAQKDQEPANASNPTSLWEEGEVIVDPYDLALPVDARGPFQIEVGLYNANTGERLAVADANGIAAGDHIILGTLGAGQ